MQRILIAAIGSLIALAALVAYLTFSRPESPVATPHEGPSDASSRQQSPTKVEIGIYASSSQRIPLERIVRQYQSDFPERSIVLEFGDSRRDLSSIVVNKAFDLYIPDDDSDLVAVREQQMLDGVLPIADMRPLLVVAAGNPLGIESLFDLLQRNARLAQADPDAVAIGAHVREALIVHGLWERVLANTTVFTGSVVEAADQLKGGTIDATIIWDGMLPAYPEFEVVPAPELAGITAHVAVGILRTSNNREAALHFARYLSARDKGLALYRASGFRVVDAVAAAIDENASP